MAAEKFNSAPKIIVNTGNTLSSDLGCSANKYLLQKLQEILTQKAKCVETSASDNLTLIQVAPHELPSVLNEHARDDMRINIKLFLNKYSSGCIQEAVSAAAQAFNTDCVDSFVLAYHPKATEINGGLNTPAPKPPCGETAEDTPKTMLNWREFNGEENFAQLKLLYQDMERYHGKQIRELGLADMDAASLKDLFADVQVIPKIAQISVATCCVVPPPLKELCDTHEIQLLTHGDAQLLLSNEQFNAILPTHTLDWSLRYQVNVTSRSLLIAKGYIVSGTSIAT